MLETICNLTHARKMVLLVVPIFYSGVDFHVFYIKIWDIPRDMEELHPNNTCEINVISPLYIINDNKSVLLYDECRITLLHKITTYYDITLDIITFQSNAFQH
jgi:hypothetical protein